MLLGIDMGGTHVDGVLIRENKIVRKVKKLVDRKKLSESLVEAIDALIDSVDPTEIERVNLSTTLSTNAIVEGNTSDVTLITQSGPGIKHTFDDLSKDTYFLSGYVDHRGKKVHPLDESELEELKASLGEKDHNLAVVTKFSARNPVHEKEIVDHFKDAFNHVTQGHRLSGRLNYPRRVNTAILNSAVHDVYANFSKQIVNALRNRNIQAPIYILKADGGTMTHEMAVERPVETILSGPAASFMGMWSLLDLDGTHILFDIGGTTTDIFFIVNGSPVFEREGIEISKHRTLVRAIFSQSIGIGGDSHVRVENGELKVGPERRGSSLTFGGETLTLTDALVLLSDDETPEAVIQGFETLKTPFQNEVHPAEITHRELAEKIVRQAIDEIYEETMRLLEALNSQPVKTIQEILEEETIEPSSLKLIGGPAAMLEPYLAERFALPTERPKHHAVANAIGAALAKPTFEVNLLADTQQGIVRIPEVDVYEKIQSGYNLNEAVELVHEVLRKEGQQMGEADPEIEIIDATSFNMVDGYLFSKNIRVHGQLKPGLVTQMRGDFDESEE